MCVGKSSIGLPNKKSISNILKNTFSWVGVMGTCIEKARGHAMSPSQHYCARIWVGGERSVEGGGTGSN
jgi:hypothetical protein